MAANEKENEVQKAVKALEAAVRKCRRAGMAVRVTYTATNEDGSTRSETIGEV